MLADYEKSLDANAGRRESGRPGEGGNPLAAARQLRSRSSTSSARSTTRPCCMSFAFVLGVAVVGRLDRAAAAGVDRGCCGSRSRCTRLRSSAGSTSPAGRRSRICIRRPSSSAGRACCWRWCSSRSTGLGLGNIVAVGDRLPHAARGPLPLARRRHVHRPAGRARHAVLAGDARRLHHARLRDDVRRRRVRRRCTSCWPTSSACSTTTTASN